MTRKGSESEILAAVVEDVRPWGRFRRFTHNQLSTVKVITVDPGRQLSLQRHQGRDELWVVLDEGLEITLGDRKLRPAVGEEIVIERGTRHRLAAIGPRPARVLEVAFGRFDEEDIERFEDDYGRV